MWFVYIRTHAGVACQKWMDNPAIGSRTEKPLQIKELSANEYNLGLDMLQRLYPYNQNPEPVARYGNSYSF